jgi:uncharacterized repeat protein (TIGR03803 family)
MPSRNYVRALLQILIPTFGLVLSMVTPVQAANRLHVLHRFSGKDGAFPRGALIRDTTGSLYGTTEFGGTYDYGIVFKMTPIGGGKWVETVLHTFNIKLDGGLPSGHLVFDSAGNLYGMTLLSTNPGSCPEGCGTIFKLAPGAKGKWTATVLHTFSGNDGDGPVDGLIFDTVGNLYGATSNGGNYSQSCPYGCGTVFKLTRTAGGKSIETVLHYFGGTDGNVPAAGLIFDTSGNLYGTTLSGGNPPCSCGTVFRLARSADGKWVETVLHDFNDKDGASPAANLIFDSVGNLYGTTAAGGAGCPPDSCGTAFKLTPGAQGKWRETVLHSFGMAGGTGPVGRLVLGAAGSLYGTTQYGGSNQSCGDTDTCGVVFKISSDGTETVLHDFSNKDGAWPLSGLTFIAGSAYGTTSEGGGDTNSCLYGCGTIFRLTLPPGKK